MGNLSKFAEVLGDLMFDEGLDAAELSKRTGLASNTLTQYIQGVRFPSLKTVITLADYFKCSTDFLLGLEQESKSKTFSPCPPFSERFKILLKDKKYSGYRFCLEHEFSESGFYDWKNGKRLPSVDNVVKIAKALEISVDYLLGREK